MAYQKLPEWRLWLRSLTPSVGSLAGGLLFVVVIVGVHLLLLSNDPSLLIPHLSGRQADDQLARVYADIVQQPLNRAFASGTLGFLSTALLWGAIGFIVYTVFDFLVTTVHDLRRSDKEINMPLKNQVIEHPLHRQLLVRIFWRVFIGMALVVFTLGVQPVISDLFRQDVTILQAVSGAEMVWRALIVLAGWMAILHVYVVLFRLFVLRTRVFGEIIY